MSNQQGYVVAHDPQLPELVGNVYLDERVARSRARSQVLLPVDVGALRGGALGGFVRRQWGNSGWLFADNAGKRGCPIAISVVPGPSYIHWAAGVIAVEDSAWCKLQLVASTDAAGGLNSGLSADRLPAPFELSETAVVRGRSRSNVLMDGFLGLGLWGVCRAVSVLWLAVSQSTLPE